MCHYAYIYIRNIYIYHNALALQVAVLNIWCRTTAAWRIHFAAAATALQQFNLKGLCLSSAVSMSRLCHLCP